MRKIPAATELLPLILGINPDFFLAPTRSGPEPDDIIDLLKAGPVSPQYFYSHFYPPAEYAGSAK